MVEYFGIFFNENESKKIMENEKVHLEKLPNNFHCTFAYKPKSLSLFNEVVGNEVEVYLIGYDCNGKNSGFEVSFSKSLSKYFKNYNKNGKLKKAHITSSLSEDSKAVYTEGLDFKRLDKPIILKGKFGYFIREDLKTHISFNKEYLDEYLK